MKSLFTVFSLGLLALAAGCVSPDERRQGVETGEKPVKEKSSAKIERGQMVGRVKSVDLASKFVLIELYVNRKRLNQGGLLLSYGLEGRESRLKVSGERMGSFAVADILSGSIEAGDGVCFLLEEATPGFFDDDTPLKPEEKLIPAGSDLPEE